MPWAEVKDPRSVSDGRTCSGYGDPLLKVALPGDMERSRTRGDDRQVTEWVDESFCKASPP